MIEIEQIGVDRSYKKLTERYLDIQLGHIAEKVVVANRGLPLAEALDYFRKDDKLTALAVEDGDKVIGVLPREKALEKSDSRFELMKGKAVSAYIADDTMRFDASDFCEKAFYTVMKEEERKVASLVVYEGSHFFGVVPVNRLIRHVTAIRELAYEQARGIQQFFLEKSASEVKGLEFAEILRMAHQIGGDFYHVREIEGEGSLFAFFDVANKDIAASLTTGILSAFFSMYFSFEKGPFEARRMVQSLNDVLFEQTPEEVFVVALILHFEEGNGSVEIFNHGYSPLYVCMPTSSGASKLARISPALVPLGIGKELELDAGAKKLQLAPSAKFFVSSDGLPDAVDAHGNRYGDARIKEFVMANIRSLKPEPFIYALRDEFERYTKDAVQVDDFSAIMIEVD